LLCQAVEASDFLELLQDTADDLSESLVSLMPPHQSLCGIVERFIAQDLRSAQRLNIEKEIPLSWLAERPHMQTAFLSLYGPLTPCDALEQLRCAVDLSGVYTMDVPRLNLQLVQKCLELPLTPPCIHDCSNRRVRVVPANKDVKHLRQLLRFYFQPFNLQHNGMLMSVVEAERRKHSSNENHSLQPRFCFRDLQQLPRIGRLLATYEERAHSNLLAAAMHEGDELPVRIAQKQDSTSLTLKSSPNLRCMEIARNCPDAQSLLTSKTNLFVPAHRLPSCAFSVASYSVSSDLSHDDSPKTGELLKEVSAGGITFDPSGLSWENRQQHIRRQVLFHNPDIICIQGLQSIGFAERCSDKNPSWFECDNEPASNHWCIFTEI